MNRVAASVAPLGTSRQGGGAGQGLIKHWQLREWNTVIGDLSANPIRPD